MAQSTRAPRSEAELLYELTTFVRETTQDFFTAKSRTEIEAIVRDRFRETELYTVGHIIESHPDVALADHVRLREPWTVSSKAIRLTDPTLPNYLQDLDRMPADDEMVELDGLAGLDDHDAGVWAFVSLEAGRAIYGGLVVHASRPDAFEEKELAAIEWFGDTISQALNAVENRRFLFASAVTELRIDCPATPLVAVADAASCRLSLESFVPASDDRILAYCAVTATSPETVASSAESVTSATESNTSATETSPSAAEMVASVAESVDGIAASRAVGGADSTVVEFAISDGSPLFAFVDGLGDLSTFDVDEQTATVVAEIASGNCAVPTLDRIHEICPDATLIAKRERNLPAASVENRITPPAEPLESLTDRQRDVLEAAYRNGYFRWPRDATAEEVADALDISSPTLHKHLRRAQEGVFSTLFDPDG